MDQYEDQKQEAEGWGTWDEVDEETYKKQKEENKKKLREKFERQQQMIDDEPCSWGLDEETPIIREIEVITINEDLDDALMTNEYEDLII